MSDKRKVSVTVYLDAAAVDEMKAISERTRVPQSVMYREAVNAYLQRRREQEELRSGALAGGM